MALVNGSQAPLLSRSVDTKCVLYNIMVKNITQGNKINKTHCDNKSRSFLLFSDHGQTIFADLGFLRVAPAQKANAELHRPE